MAAVASHPCLCDVIFASDARVFSLGCCRCLLSCVFRLALVLLHRCRHLRGGQLLRHLLRAVPVRFPSAETRFGGSTLFTNDLSLSYLACSLFLLPVLTCTVFTWSCSLCLFFLFLTVLKTDSTHPWAAGCFGVLPLSLAIHSQLRAAPAGGLLHQVPRQVREIGSTILGRTTRLILFLVHFHSPLLNQAHIGAIFHFSYMKSLVEVNQAILAWSFSFSWSDSI